MRYINLHFTYLLTLLTYVDINSSGQFSSAYTWAAHWRS